MNTAYKMEKSLLAAVLAILAVSMVFVGIAAEAEAATGDATSSVDYPQRTIEFDTVLGYEYLALSETNPEYDHTQYWTASFDFSDSIDDGKYWPYGNDAIIAVTFYFSDGSNNDVGSIAASKTLCYPVYQLEDGSIYVEDVCCTPDLWPSEDNVYPVQVEAVIYTTLYNDTAANGQY